MHHFVIDDLFSPNLLLAIEICRKNGKKNRGVIWGKPRKCRVSTSFAQIYSSVFTFWQHICSEQILFVQIHFFRLVLKQQL